MTLDVALDKPLPLAVIVVLPAPTPVSVAMSERFCPERITTEAGTVATSGALLVRLTVKSLVAVWFEE